jgi:hypothetical protein
VIEEGQRALDPLSLHGGHLGGGRGDAQEAADETKHGVVGRMGW